MSNAVRNAFNKSQSIPRVRTYFTYC